MKKPHHPSFDAFTKRFVRVYWQTVKERKFPMPPDEPVDETLDELLAAISFEVATDQAETIVMISKEGGWWRFSFRYAAGAWIIIGAGAKSQSPKQPHDLLRPPYDRCFHPFLEHVTRIAQSLE